MQDTNFVAWVNPVQGTDSSFEFSHGNCLPLISRPFGMTSWSPQTDEGPWLFSYGARKLQGIRATHQPSPWMGDYGHFTVMPQTGPVALSAEARASSYRHDETAFAPHHFKTTLSRYRTTLELTPTERCACLRVSFPETEAARIIVQPFEGASLVEVDLDARTLTGFTRANSGGCPENFACYFVAVFDQPLTGAGVFRADGSWTEEKRGSGDRVGAFVEVDASAGLTIEVRIATSFISLEGARRNLEHEIGNRSFDTLLEEGRDAWNALLGRAVIEGGGEEQTRTFYSCLYRSLLFPRKLYEYGEDGAPVHYSPYDGRVHPGVLYADNGFWDTFRTVYPLLALLYPAQLAEILEGWVQAYREGGWFPRWASPGYRDCMVGTHLDAVIADAYLRGVRGFDIETAYAGVRRDALEQGSGAQGRSGLDAYMELGYVPVEVADHAAARTQEYAYTDFCVAQLARVLGHDDDARLFYERALSYRYTFDPGVGFMRGRKGDGSWLEPFDPFSWDTRAYIEGSAWQYSWAVPHDPAGLIALMGGDKAFTAKLEQMLTLPPHFEVGGYPQEIHEMTEMGAANLGQYAHSNQPVHHVLYLFTCAGQPWKTQLWVRRVLELYTSGPQGFPGDEDNGEMSAWYLLSAMGLFPLCPGHPSFVLGSPLFTQVTLYLEGDEPLVIEATGNDARNVYVESVTFNGEPHTRSWIGHDELFHGGKLVFTMCDTPPTDQELHLDQRPFSLSHSGEG